MPSHTDTDAEKTRDRDLVVWSLRAVGYLIAGAAALALVALFAASAWIALGRYEAGQWRERFASGGSFASTLPPHELVRVQHDDLNSSAVLAFEPAAMTQFADYLSEAVEQGPPGDETVWQRTPVADPRIVRRGSGAEQLASKPDGFYGALQGDVLVVFPGERRAYLFARQPEP